MQGVGDDFDHVGVFDQRNGVADVLPGRLAVAVKVERTVVPELVTGVARHQICFRLRPGDGPAAQHQDTVPCGGAYGPHACADPEPVQVVSTGAPISDTEHDHCL